MLFLKNISLAAALALTCATTLFAATPVYKEAAAPWSCAQAQRLAPAISAEFLKAVAEERGPEAAARLAEKKERVTALLGRYKNCTLRPGDAEMAEKYFTQESAAEIRYFAQGGCEAFKAAAKTQAPAGSDAGQAAREASVRELQARTAAGDLATREGAARFFDGYAARGAAAPAVTKAASAGPAAAAAPSAPSAARPSRPLSSRVPLPPAVRASMTAPERPADLGKDGRVHRAMAYWLAMRKENLAALKTGELSGSEKAKAAGKLAAGAVFHGLLWVSNLDNVEIAAARLGWDVGQGAGAGVIASDAAKLLFHSAVFAMLLAPIPLTKVAAAALAGEPWAIAFAAAMAAGPANRYIFHFAD